MRIWIFTTLAVLVSWPAVAQHAEIIRSTGGLPTHIVGLFEEPSSFQQSESGEYFVFDRGTHAVYRINAQATEAQKIVDIGHEDGQIIEPSAFAIDPSGAFVVADAPHMRERVQLFHRTGQRLSGFTLPGRSAPRLRIGGIVLNGVGSLQYTGDSVLINLPETGALVTQYLLSGRAWRTFGHPRRMGSDDDRDVHLALNSGLPLIDPTGGFYFVFQAGQPVFRKYNQAGQLVFERHVEGRELDPIIQSLPTAWDRQPGGADDILPLVPPTVRTAAVDQDGNLWIALIAPYTYVYNPDGEKVRTIQFRGAGLMVPTSLFFASASRLLVTPGCYEFTVR